MQKTGFDIKERKEGKDVDFENVTMVSLLSCYCTLSLCIYYKIEKGEKENYFQAWVS